MTGNVTRDSKYAQMRKYRAKEELGSSSTHDVDEEIPSHLEDPRLDEERSELTDQDDIEIIEEPVETAERE